MQVSAEGVEEGLVERDLTALDALPGAVGRRARDREVDPVAGNTVLGFVVDYGL